nr:MAG TPA: Baseplate structural protein [Caudoviricetes sp.]
MPLISKPSNLNKIWSVNGVNTAPTDVKINNGFVVEIPPYQWFNYIENKQDQAIAHINQMGIPVWDSQTEYQAGKSQVQGSDGKIYRAFLTTTNVNPVGDSSGSWFDPNESGMVVLTSVGSSTWTVPPILRSGFKTAKVTVIGAGGSGGSGTGPTTTGTRGAGGGAGGTAIAKVSLAGVASVPVVIGAGGTRAFVGNTNGQAGGNSVFNSTITGVGGSGGSRYNSTTAPAGGFGGTASGGQLNLRGGDGSDGPVVTADGIGGSGDGGVSSMGGGTRGSTSSVTTVPAYGAGGGGGVTGSNPGGNGVVIIEY